MKHARHFMLAACVLAFVAFSEVALAARTTLTLGAMIDLGGSMAVPEVATAIISRAAMLSLLTVSIYLVVRRGVRRPAFLVLLLPITGIIVLVCLLSWQIESTIARTLILTFYPQVISVGFLFEWPPAWLAPLIGFPLGAWISVILWRRKTRMGIVTALSVLAALATLLIRIRVPGTMGDFDLGDVFVILAGLWLGPVAGLLVGIIGPTVAHATVVPQLVLATAVTKGLEGLLVGLIGYGDKARFWRKILAVSVGAITNVVWLLRLSRVHLPRNRSRHTLLQCRTHGVI